MIIHAERKDREADQPAHLEDARVTEAISAGVAVLNDLPHEHEEGKSRGQRDDPEEHIVEPHGSPVQTLSQAKPVKRPSNKSSARVSASAAARPASQAV